MEAEEVKHLDIDNILKNTNGAVKLSKTTTVTEEVHVMPTSSPNVDQLERVVTDAEAEDANEKLKTIGHQIIRETDLQADIKDIDENIKRVGETPTNYDITTVVNNSDSDKLIVDVINQYNEKYGTDIKIASIKDAISIAVNANEIQGELSSAMISNTVIALVDYTQFSMAIMLCQQLNSLVRNLIESEELDNVTKLQVIDRLFNWLEKLDQIKARYTQRNIDAIMKRMESARRMDAGSSQAVTKLLNLLRKTK